MFKFIATEQMIAYKEENFNNDVKFNLLKFYFVI